MLKTKTSKAALSRKENKANISKEQPVGLDRREESLTATSLETRRQDHVNKGANDANRISDKNMDNKVRMCLNFLRISAKNKLLNSFLREDIIEYESQTGQKFNEPVDFYKINDEFKARYNISLTSKNLKFTKNEKNITISCPNCKSTDVIVQYKQFLSGDEVETEVIQCNYCGGVYTNL